MYLNNRQHLLDVISTTSGVMDWLTNQKIKKP